MSEQGDLFGVGPQPPEGFRYQPEVLSRDEEQAILEGVRTLSLRPFEFRAYTGNRRVVSFGWRYDFKEEALHGAEEIPAFLLRARDVAAGFVGIPAVDFVHVLVTEYPPDAGIGWHRDKSVFGDVVGVSLLSSCVFRLRRKVEEKWERYSVTAEPRSAYLLTGRARSEWEHSIPPVDRLRYSVTFRTLKDETATRR